MNSIAGMWKKSGQLKILVVFTTLAVFLVVSTYYGTKVLSSVRAYIAGEGVWSKAQKEATQQLLEYSLYQNEIYYEEFRETLELHYHFSQSRKAMSSSDLDHELARKGFQSSNLSDEDIELLIWLGSNFSNMPYLHEAFAIWEQADQQITKMDSLAKSLNREIQLDNLTEQERDRYINNIRSVDHRLTELESAFSSTLAAGANKIHEIIFWIILGSGTLIIGLGYWIISSYLHEIHLLNKELEDHSLVAKKTTDLVIIMDSTGQIKWVNNTFEQLTGYTLDEVEGKDPAHVLHGPDTDSVAAQNLSESINQKKSVQQRILNYTRDGEKIWFDATIDPVFDEDGNCTQFVAIKRDVSDQVKQEKEVKESLERYNIVSKATSDTIWELDLTTNKIRYNDVVREMFGYSKTEVEQVDNWWKENIHPEDQQYVYNTLDDALENGKDRFQLEYRFRCADGSYKYVYDRAFVVTVDGEPVRIIGAMQDITERKQVEDALKSSRQRMATLFSNLPGMAYRCSNDRNWSMIFLSEGCLDITGYPADVFVENDSPPDMFYGDIIHEDDKEDVWNTVQEAIDNKHPYELTYRIYHKDGEIRWVWERGVVAASESGNEIYLEGFISDITDRKRTKEKLEQTERKMREIIEYSTNMFYRHTPDHVLTYVSPQSRQFLGCEPDEAKKRWTEFVTDNPINEKGFVNTQRAIKTGETQPPFELELQKTDGEIIWVEVNEAPIVEEGETVAIVGALTDITERKKAEEEISEALKEKETLLAEVHHRVKNNMAVVSGIMQLQAFQEDDPNLKEKLFANVARIGTMASIHENLYESEKFATLQFSENLKTIVHKLIKTMQSQTEVSVNTALDPIQLNLNQAIPCSLIVSEVITNALKHAFRGREQGKLAMSLKKNESQVDLWIKDDGIGFSDEDGGAEPDKSLGFHLIDKLSMQLDAEYRYESLNGGGTQFHLQFEKEK